MGNFMTVLVTSGVVGVVIASLGTIINEALKWARQRKAYKEDKAETKQDRCDEMAKHMELVDNSLAAINESLKGINTRLDGLQFSDRAILFDRIKYLCLAYLKDGSIDFDDRVNLHRMHTAYHDYCGGNGDLDSLMKDVDKLPLNETMKS